MKTLKADIKKKLLVTFQGEYKDHLERIRHILAKAEANAYVLAKLELDDVYRSIHSLKGAARAVDLREVESLFHGLESKFSDIREGRQILNADAIRNIYQELNSSEDMVNKACSVPEKSEILALLNDHSIRVKSKNLDHLIVSAGLLKTEGRRQEIAATEFKYLETEINQIKNEWSKTKTASAGVLRRLSKTPDAAKVLEYLEMVGVKLNILTKQIQKVKSIQRQSAWNVSQIGEQVENNTRLLRVVSVESIFGDFRKMVRDLAQEESKEVEFLTFGFEVEADRLVLQLLKDPVMHMLRNALGHGLESLQDRIKSGKDPIGRISLDIKVSGNRLILRLDDDGRGLDFGAIATTAVRNRLISEEEAEAHDSQNIARLIFQPGFSTSKIVADLSGRGMGLSAVYEAVTRLQGHIEILPGIKSGVSFSISVPLTISNLRLIYVESAGQIYAIPTYNILRIHRMKVASVETIDGTPFVRLLGQVIPLISLAYLINKKENSIEVKNKILELAVMQFGGKYIAIVVDALLDVQEGYVKELPECVKANLFLGSTMMLDGKLSLVVNPAELASLFSMNINKFNIHHAQEIDCIVKKKRILVVDDSITTRTMEQSILETYGYEVFVAVDGRDALKVLNKEKIDLILSDLEMPVLDGFGLLEEVKKDSRFMSIPFLLVTSRNSPVDQEKGLSLGADAYIVKQKFEQQALLETVRQFI